MTKAVQVRSWLAMLAGAVVLVGCGIFFAFQNLGNAALYASVASFFLALLTASGSVLSLVRSKSREQTANGSKEDQPPRRNPVFNWIINIAVKNKHVQTGPESVMSIIEIVQQSPRKGGRRNR